MTIPKSHVDSDSYVSVENSNSLAFISMREEFIKWLSNGNAKKFSPQTSVVCLDKISEYVVSKKISCSIWEISKPGVFKPIYQKVMDTKTLRIMERHAYKTFAAVGLTYMKFLKERP